MKTVRWGIIGCGDVTEVKSGPGFQKARNSQLVAVMRRNGRLAEDYARRHGVPKWYDAADALINDNEVDAVYIATPPNSHKEYALAVARAGKPAYVEKPMAMNHRECVEMVDVFRKNNLPLFTAYYRRGLPRFLRVKAMIDDGSIGEVRAVVVRFFQRPSAKDQSRAANWRTDPAIAGAGYFFDLGSHMLDLLQYFFGPVKGAAGFSSNRLKLYDAEDCVSASFQFENGVQGVGMWDFGSGEDLDMTEIVGSSGKISYATFLDQPVVLQRGRGVEEILIPHPDHVQQPLIQTVVDELTGVGKSLSTGSTGAHTSWVMDRILGRV